MGEPVSGPEGEPLCVGEGLSGSSQASADGLGSSRPALGRGVAFISALEAEDEMNDKLLVPRRHGW